MLNSEVAMGRRMKGAEICIFVPSARSFEYESCASTHSGRYHMYLILIERSESFLNALPDRFPKNLMRGWWPDRLGDVILPEPAPSNHSPWSDILRSSNRSMQPQSLSGHIRILESSTGIKQYDAVLCGEEPCCEQMIVCSRCRGSFG